MIRQCHTIVDNLLFFYNFVLPLFFFGTQALYIYISPFHIYKKQVGFSPGDFNQKNIIHAFNLLVLASTMLQNFHSRNTQRIYYLIVILSQQNKHVSMYNFFCKIIFPCNHFNVSTFKFYLIILFKNFCNNARGYHLVHKYQQIIMTNIYNSFCVRQKYK